MASYEIRHLNDTESLDKLLEIYVEVFKEPAPSNRNHLATLLDRDEILFLGAYINQAMVGGLTAYFLPSIYGNYSEIFIYDIAVSNKYQRHGIGSQLLDNLKQYSKAIGVENIFVQAHTEDVEALNFYKKNGGIEEDVRLFNFKIS